MIGTLAKKLLIDLILSHFWSDLGVESVSVISQALKTYLSLWSGSGSITQIGSGRVSRHTLHCITYTIPIQTTYSCVCGYVYVYDEIVLGS